MALPAISARSASAVSIWPRWRAQRVDARIERRVGALGRIGRQRAGDQRGLEQRLGLEQRGERIGGRELRAVEQRQAFLGAERDRLEPGGTSASPAGTRPCGVKHSPTPIIAAVMCASGARSPDAPTEPCAGTTGMTSLRQHGFQQLERCRPDAGGALREAGELQRHHQPRRRRPASARRRRRHARARCCAAASRDRRRRCARWPACRSRC